MSKYHKNISSAMSNKMLQIRKRNLRKSFQDFSQQEHRLEQVAEYNKIIFIDDSKSQSVNATYFALKSLRKPIVWIVGGDDVATDYTELLPLVRLKVESIIMIGKDNFKLHSVFDSEVKEIYEVKSMSDAVNLAKSLSYKGTTVLLSPACKPDDLYASAEQRGELFKQAVLKL